MSIIEDSVCRLIYFNPVSLVLLIWFGFIFSFILKSLLDLRDQYISSRWRSLKKSVYLFRWNPGSAQDILCKLQTKPKNNLMIEMSQMLCFITKSATITAPLSLQEGFIFHDPSLLWALPICSLVVFWAVAIPGFVPVRIPSLWKLMMLQSEE